MKRETGFAITRTWAFGRILIFGVGFDDACGLGGRFQKAATDNQRVRGERGAER
jgi:hypothetical protein